MALTDTRTYAAQSLRPYPDQATAPDPRRAMLFAKLPLPVVLYLLCVVLPVGFHLGPLALSLLRLLLLAMVVPMLLQLFTGRYGKVLLTDILFMLHILWAAVSIFVNNPQQVIEHVGSFGLEFIGGYLLGRAYIRSAGDFIALARWVVFLAICTLPIALIETATRHPVVLELINKLPGITDVFLVVMQPRMGLDRVQAVFAHPIHYGLFCSVAFSLAFVALHGITRTFWRYGSSTIVAVCGFLALSSGALLAILLQMALILWAKIWSRYWWRWRLLVGLFVLAYIVIDLLSDRTPVRVFMSYATFSVHNAYYRALIFEYGMQNVWANWLFGIGLGDWFRPAYMHGGTVDNFWLVVAMRYGIPAFLLLAVGYAWAIFLVMRRNLDANPVLLQIRRAWVFTFLGLSFTLCTVHVWTNIYSFVFFMFGAGIWMLKVDPAVTAPAAPPRVDAFPPAVGGITNRYSRFPAKRRPVPPTQEISS